MKFWCIKVLRNRSIKVKILIKISVFHFIFRFISELVLNYRLFFPIIEDNAHFQKPSYNPIVFISWFSSNKYKTAFIFPFESNLFPFLFEYYLKTKKSRLRIRRPFLIEGTLCYNLRKKKVRSLYYSRNISRSAFDFKNRQILWEYFLVYLVELHLFLLLNSEIFCSLVAQFVSQIRYI